MAANVNVMKMVKRKRVARPAVKRVAPKKIEKAVEFRFQRGVYKFHTIPMEFVLDSINDYVLRYAEKFSTDELATLNKVRYAMPWSLVKPFFQEYADQSGLDFIAFYAKYVKKPAVAERYAAMRKLIELRKVTAYKGKYVEPAPETTGAKKEACYLCKENYRYAPWLYEMDPTPIDGFAVKANGPYDAYRSDEKLDREWYKVKNEFYDFVCDTKRKFYAGQLAYVTFVGNLIVENRKMYDAAIKYDLSCRTKRERTFFGAKEYAMTDCEKQYKRAPWMSDFAKTPIRGMAVKSSGPLAQYATDYAVVGDWKRVKYTWYEMACKVDREYREGEVAYVTADKKSVIVETYPMYLASFAKLKELEHVSLGPTTAKSFDVALQMLKENALLAESKMDLGAVLSSFPTKTNFAFARALSQVLVYLKPLIFGDQVHLERIRHDQYRPEDLIQLDRYTVLPEIYKNPNATAAAAKMELLVRRDRETIENVFYERVRGYSREIRPKPMGPAGNIKKPTIALPTVCPTGVKDLVYYAEDGELYCFDRSAIANETRNPVTGKPFKKSFMRELSFVKPRAKTEEEIKASAKPRVVLAPGLLEKLRDDIMNLNALYCDACDVEIAIPARYASVSSGRPVTFCDKDCFERFKF